MNAAEGPSSNEREIGGKSIEGASELVGERKRKRDTSDADPPRPEMPPRDTPTSILSSEECTIQSLTVSDQHATLLLNHGPDSSKKSLLKLITIPFHRTILGSNPIISPGESDNQKIELNLLKNDLEASRNIIKFLDEYKFELKSESGAEYSYFKAVPSTNICEGENKLEIGSFDAELISPANDRQLSRAMPSLGSVLIHETPEIYEKIVQPYIKSIVDGDSLAWIDNIIQVKKEQERLLVNDDKFIINIDTKWRSHPDCFKVPRENWMNHESTVDLYCLGIVKEKGIASLRDLTSDHIPLLKDMQEKGLEAIENIYGIQRDQIRVFAHYHPQFYHFHLHYTRLENEIGSTVERGHLVSDIIQNLEQDGKFYQKRTITFKLKKMSPLHNVIQHSKA
jgi:m7GpppX diphosphatase